MKHSDVNIKQSDMQGSPSSCRKWGNMDTTGRSHWQEVSHLLMMGTRLGTSLTPRMSQHGYRVSAVCMFLFRKILETLASYYLQDNLNLRLANKCWVSSLKHRVSDSKSANFFSSRSAQPPVRGTVYRGWKSFKTNDFIYNLAIDVFMRTGTLICEQAFHKRV